jgi:hypothetical protein
MKAANGFRHKMRWFGKQSSGLFSPPGVPTQLWQTDAAYLMIIGWL